MDYSPYDISFTAEGRRRVHAFSYILAYSRRQYVRFVETQDFATTIREHVRAFEYFAPLHKAREKFLWHRITRREDNAPHSCGSFSSLDLAINRESCWSSFRTLRRRSGCPSLPAWRFV